jgi:predicted PurR-regulated permease PerM
MSSIAREDLTFLRRATEAAIRIGLVALLALLCLRIVGPFLEIMAWGVILAVAVGPVFDRITNALGGRRKTTAALLILVTLALLLAPAILFVGAVTDPLVETAAALSEGTLTLPPPPDWLEKLPLVGSKLEAQWAKAASDAPAFLKSHGGHVVALGGWILSAAADVGFGVLGFAFSILIAGILLATAERGTHTAEAISARLDGERGVHLLRISAATIRSVAVGVVGVGLIQAVLAGIGFVAVGVPAAGVWALLVLILAVAQLPAILVMLPIAIYVFTTSSTTVAIVFAIWALIVGLSDNVLKPLLLGRGVKVPMIVILIGSLGGMISMGILGLFIGAVVLAVGHQICVAWASEDAVPGDAAGA